MANKVMKRDGWYISYLPSAPKTDLLFGIFAGIDTPPGGETAITEEGDGYLILVGDWREAYDKCQTFEEAVGVYKANIEQRSPWSEDDHLRVKYN